VKEDFTPKKNNKKRGYVAGVPTFKSKTVVFNPGSRHHIANRLKAMYGWKPKEMTDKGQPKVDETVLEKLRYPEAKLLTEYLLVQKRLGMLAEGDNAWLKMVKPNGRIHGEVITNGAVTGRATHRNPNIAQVPAVKALYGKECRTLFTVPKDRVLVGVDVSGLELRMLAFFMKDLEYAREVCDGDIHTVNQKAAGLATRDQAKTFIYAFCYGAGPEKIGSIAGGGAKHGKELRKQFLERTPALNALILDVKRAAERGYLKGLDGRRLHIRSDHAALNTLLQSAGALVCKQWMVEVDRMLALKQWSHKVQQVAWIHDECQFECDPDIADEFGREAIDCIRKAGEFFKLSVPLTGEHKIGKNWAETH
jgi:DNA polymerase I-like protein with 3'-5' exonuclease and polymerase domains